MNESVLTLSRPVRRRLRKIVQKPTDKSHGRRSVPKHSPLLRRPSIVVFEDTSQPFSTFNGSAHIRLVARFLDETVIESLVITLKVIMFRVFHNGFTKMSLS